MQSDINERLKEINIEDFIWIVYLGIIALSFYSNSLEKKYFINKNQEDKDKYQKIIILIFSILIVVYLYFLKSSIDSIKELKESDSNEKKVLTYLSFIASLLVAISGFIYLYIAFNDKDINIELAFN